jgi:DNA mismatch repair protein MutL
MATVKEALGKFNIGPSIDFNAESAFEIPILKNDQEVKIPEIKVNTNFNPFSNKNTINANHSFHSGYEPPKVDKDWQSLYAGSERGSPGQMEIDPIAPSQATQTSMSGFAYEGNNRFYQFKGRYILTNVKSGLMVIDQKRAHERVLFDEYMLKSSNKLVDSQKLLYPERLELSQGQAAEFREIMDDLNHLGFETTEFGGTSFVVSAVPAGFPDKDVRKWITELLLLFEDNPVAFRQSISESIARSLARYLSVGYGKPLSHEEMANLNDRLFTSPMPNFDPWGKPVISIISLDEIEKRFK